MSHEIKPPEGRRIGFLCSCGKKFMVESAAYEHAASADQQEELETIGVNDDTDDDTVAREEDQEVAKFVEAAARATLKRADEAEAQENSSTSQKPKSDKNEQQNTQSQKALSPMQQTANMVRSYATRFVSDQRSQQFYARLSLMMTENPKLKAVKPSSLLVAAMECVKLDLMPNTPEGYAYIIPYGDQAQFILGFKGVAELAYRSGVVRSISADIVFPEDEFKAERGGVMALTHTPNWDIDRTDAASIIRAYAIAELTSGAKVFEVMTRPEIEKVRAVSKAKSTDAPWQVWYEAMAKKSAVKRLGKLIPSSAEDNRFKTAIEWDSLNEAGKRLRYDTETGEVAEDEQDAITPETEERINQAQSRRDLNNILQELTMGERRNAVDLVRLRMKELS